MSLIGKRTVRTLKNFECINAMDPNDQDKWFDIAKSAASSLDDTPILKLTAYTPHDFSNHCFNILGIISDVLLYPESFNSIQLSSESLLLLNMAVLFHDYSMTKPGFTEQDRRKHSELSAQMFCEIMSNSLHINILTPDQVKLVSKIIRAHSDIRGTDGAVLERTLELDVLEEKVQGYDGKDIPLKFLSGLLRLADELDITAHRIGNKTKQISALDESDAGQGFSRKCWEQLLMFNEIRRDGNKIVLKIDREMYNGTEKADEIIQGVIHPLREKAMAIYSSCFDKDGLPRTVNAKDIVVLLDGEECTLECMTTKKPDSPVSPQKKKQLHIYWVGPRESDISAIKDMFYGSITLFGEGDNSSRNHALCNSKTNTGRVDHNQDDIGQDLFFIDKIREIARQDDNARFYLYNGNIFHKYNEDLRSYEGCLEEFRDRFLNLNKTARDGGLPCMRDFGDKSYFHNVLAPGAKIPVLEVVSGGRVNCRHSEIRRMLKLNDENCRLIVQAPISSGGNGTFLLDKFNEKEVARRLDKSINNYLYSQYRENNVPVNIHGIIFDNEILLSPGSIQIICEVDDRLMYRGADFVTYGAIEEASRKSFEHNCLLLFRELQRLGYRGVCGADGIIYPDPGDPKKNCVKILELNNRFQASTSLINEALAANDMRSIQELNLDAFNHLEPREGEAEKLASLKVNYSNFSFMHSGSNLHSDNLLSRHKNEKHVIKAELDGYVAGQDDCVYDSCSYLYRLVFNTNITWINEDNLVLIHENILEPGDDWLDLVSAKKDVLAFKIALLTQGVVIDPIEEKRLERIRGIRPATNNAIDLIFPKLDDIVINAPLNIKFNSLSPFTLHCNVNGGLELYYYNSPYQPAANYRTDPLSGETTTGGIGFSDVAYLSTDRLRIHITNQCIYKQAGRPCSFCNIDVIEGQNLVDLKDIREVLDAYSANLQTLGIRHFMVGGQSASNRASEERLAEVIKIIRQHVPDMPIYAMVLPCSNRTLNSMIDAGLTELTYNIEIFDDKLAKKYMPGKGDIENRMAKYIKALSYAVTAIPRDPLRRHYYPVRSVVIVGLEPHESFLNGIKELISKRIQPIISIFRPLPETALADCIAPSMEYLYKLYKQVDELCREGGLRLGPHCKSCQNNTLSLPY